MKSIADQRCQRPSNEVSRSRASPTVLGSCFSRSNGSVAREFEAVFYTNHCQSFLLLVTVPIDRERAPWTSCRRHLLFRSARPQSVYVGRFDVPVRRRFRSASSSACTSTSTLPSLHPSLGTPPKPQWWQQQLRKRGPHPHPTWPRDPPPL